MNGLVLAVGAAVMLFSTCVHAYVDPGSGSVIVTTILGILAAVGYTARKFWYRIKRFLSNSTAEPDEPGDAPGGERATGKNTTDKV